MLYINWACLSLETKTATHSLTYWIFSELANNLHTFFYKYYFVVRVSRSRRFLLLVLKCSSKSCVEFLFIHVS